MDSAAIDPQRLWAHVEPFSSTVRASGSAEEAEAFAYARRVLDEVGYETRLLRHEAYVSLPRSASLTLEGEAIPCIAHAMSASSAGLRARLVPAEDDTDVRGAIALARGLAGPAAVRDLVRRGAVGAVFINADQRYEMIVSPIWGSPDASSVRDLPNVPVVSVAQDAAERLVPAAREGADVTLVSEVETGWREIPLLDARLEAPTGDGDVVLFSGHIDAWHLGAMDNGGANAVMLEVATVMAEERAALRRDLRLLFWSGHSHGRYAGSAWYADTHYEDLRDHAVLHVNIDSVGGRGATVLSEAPSMPETFGLAARAIADETGETYRGARYGRAGDQSFWGHGVSSVLMGLSEQPVADDVASRGFADLFGGGRGGGFGWWWHTPEDTVDKLDPAFLERDCRIYLRLVREACTSIVPPLEYSRTATTLRGRLEEHARAVADRLDLSRAVERARTLEEALSLYETRLAEHPDSHAWRVLKAVALRLVPLDYVKGSPHRHDPALPQPPLPALEGIETLARATDANLERHLRVGLRREVNRIALELREATDIVEEALRSASGARER